MNWSVLAVHIVRLRVPGLGLGAGKSADPSLQVIRGLQLSLRKGGAGGGPGQARPEAWWLSEGLAEVGVLQQHEQQLPLVGPPPLSLLP